MGESSVIEVAIAIGALIAFILFLGLKVDPITSIVSGAVMALISLVLLVTRG